MSAATSPTSFPIGRSLFYAVRMRRAIFIGTTALALAVGGCSSSAKQEAASQAPPTVAAITAPTSTTPAPSPSPTTWSIKLAGVEYLKFVAPLNQASAQYNEHAKDPNVTLQTLVSDIKALVAAEDTFTRKLSAAPWPDSVKDKVSTLVAAHAKVRAAEQGLATAPSMNDFNAASNSDAFQSAQNDASGAAQTLRIALGLPGTS